MAIKQSCGPASAHWHHTCRSRHDFSCRKRNGNVKLECRLFDYEFSIHNQKVHFSVAYSDTRYHVFLKKCWKHIQMAKEI